jgi:DNA-binding NtrC family response regulator
MPDQGDFGISGSRVLVLEDEYMIADDIARALRAAGATPVGPVASLDRAEAQLADGQIDGAVVGMNLRGQKAFAFVERLARAGIPCVIVSGYSQDALPDSIAALPRLEKPTSVAKILRALGEQLDKRRVALHCN